MMQAKQQHSQKFNRIGKETVQKAALGASQLRGLARLDTCARLQPPRSNQSRMCDTFESIAQAPHITADTGQKPHWHKKLKHNC